MISKDIGIGIVLLYNGSGIGVGNGTGSTDPEKRYTRTNEISIDNGDSFDLKGFYVCNGKNGNPDLVGAYDSGKFIKGANYLGSNQSGGNDDAVLVQHNHTGTSGYGGIHNHGTTVTSSNHTHVIQNIVTMSVTNYGWSFTTGGGDNNVRTGSQCESTRESYGDHSHSTINATTAGAHTHTTSSSGTDSTTGRNMPMYHSVIPIIRKS